MRGLHEKKTPPPAEDARIWGFRNSSGIPSPSRSSLRIPGFGDSGIWGLSPNPALPRLRGLGAGIRGLGHCPRVPKSWPRRNCSGRAGIWGLSPNPQIPASPNPGRDAGTARIWGQFPNAGPARTVPAGVSIWGQCRRPQMLATPDDVPPPAVGGHIPLAAWGGR